MSDKRKAPALGWCFFCGELLFAGNITEDRFVLTVGANDQLLVTVGHGAVAKALTRCTAANADANYLVRISELLGHAIVEHVQRSQKILAWVLLHVGTDAAVELIHVFESLLLQISRRFLTAHTVSANCQHFLALKML